ncbi:MAG: hypothetical protein ACFFG0_07165 [Candidatus Thorarchaeota archaeon]
MANDSDFEFHKTNIEDLVEDGKNLINLPNFPRDNLDQFYTRNDKMGWWMPIKQIIIRDYIDFYLAIMARNLPEIKLYFIDLMSSWGMNRITKYEGRDEFIFPGTSLNAVLISLRSSKSFDMFFVNDLDYKKRKILKKRFETLNTIHNNLLDITINTEEKKVDSNQWVIKIVNSIKKEYSNYLMVIDNEGMDIELDTIKKIREIDNYGDIIITFQNNIIRTIKQSPEKTRKFFGRPIRFNEINKDKINEIYVKQLKRMGLKLEQIKIDSGIGFFYTLLFCCRNNVSAKWLRRYKEYSEKQFKNFTGERFKSFWDRVTGRIRGIDEF